MTSPDITSQQIAEIIKDYGRECLPNPDHLSHCGTHGNWNDVCKDFRLLIAAYDQLQQRLDKNVCNSGHVTLPLALWDCPECHNLTRRERDDMKNMLACAVARVAEVEGMLASLGDCVNLALREANKDHAQVTDYLGDMRPAVNELVYKITELTLELNAFKFAADREGEV